MGSEEAEGVITPVITQAEFAQSVILHELVDRHQFDGGDTKILQVFNDLGMRQTRVGAAEVLRDVRVRHRHALHMGFIDDGLVVRGAWCAVIAPVEERVDHDGLHRMVNAVLGVPAVGVLRISDVIAEKRGIAVILAGEGTGIGIHEELGGITTLAVVRVPGTVDAVAIALTWLYAGDVAVPDVIVLLIERDSCFLPIVVNEAEFNAFSDVGEQCEVGARTVVFRTERICLAGPYGVAVVTA